MLLIKDIEFEEVIKIIRNIISRELNYDKNRIFNGYSVRGADLQRVVNDTKVTSFSLADTFIVFTFTEDMDNYAVTKEFDDNYSTITRYSFNIKGYGNACHSLIGRILVLFKKEMVLRELYDNGIYIVGLDTPKQSTEFINETVWERCDTSIKINIRMNFTDDDKSYTIENLKTLKVDKI